MRFTKLTEGANSNAATGELLAFTLIELLVVIFADSPTWGPDGFNWPVQLKPS